MSEVDRPFWRIGNPVLWGIAASLAITLAACWLATQQTCIAGIDGVALCQSKLSYLKAAPPNEVGDALAGVAGVLAFIWIIVTVAMQAEELRAQREVLRLTRDEMAEQRKATQDMARSMALQAAIFEDEQEQRRQEIQSRVLDQKISGLGSYIKDVGIDIFWGKPIPKDIVFLGPYGERLFSNDKSLLSLEPDAFIWKQSLKAKLSYDYLAENQGDLASASFPDRTAALALKEKVDALIKLSEFVTEDQKERMSRIGVYEIRDTIHSLLRLPIWSDHEGVIP